MFIPYILVFVFSIPMILTYVPFQRLAVFVPHYCIFLNRAHAEQCSFWCITCKYLSFLNDFLTKFSVHGKTNTIQSTQKTWIDSCHLHLDAVVKQDHHNKHLFCNTLMMLAPFCDAAVVGTTDTYVAAPSKEHLFFVYIVYSLQIVTK